MRRNTFPAAMTLCAGLASAQFQSMEESPYIAHSSPTGKDYEENTLFEARPLVNFRLYGNFDDQFLNPRRFDHKFDVVFDPMIRMFNSESVPVRMPSYRIFLSWAGMYVAGNPADPHHVFSVALQHGHYSNGQEGCPFGDSDDLSADCAQVRDNLESLDLDGNLNRRGGEFSTDFLRARGKYLWLLDYFPNSPREKHALEFTGSYTALVDWWFGAPVGGYVEEDAGFYPMHQLGAEAAYHRYCRKECVEIPFTSYRFGRHWRTGMEAFWKGSDHDDVYPWLFSAFGAFFLKESNLGYMVKGEFGQDPYNLRLVDKIARVMVGITWYVDELVQVEKGMGAGP